MGLLVTKGFSHIKVFPRNNLDDQGSVMYQERPRFFHIRVVTRNRPRFRHIRVNNCSLSQPSQGQDKMEDVGCFGKENHKEASSSSHPGQQSNFVFFFFSFDC